jgi:hydroxymethylpyrimidine pyrophosphatase-like HAD family hydrolase
MGYLGKPILCCDYDGTIRQGKRLNSKNNRLMPFCKEVIKRLYTKGCRFIVWTTRKDLSPVRENLKAKKILRYFEEINENVKEIRFWKTRKIYADYYIDDLNVGGLINWQKVYEIVMRDEYFTRTKI